MQTEIITIGDELLIGQTVNTNAAWIGKELSINGFNVFRCTTITDAQEDILISLENALSRSEFVIITGGLGPTKDDVTKETLCEFFDTKLTLRKDVLERIKMYFEDKGREMLPSNIQQAELPEACMVLDNHLGTASGMWFEKEGKIIVSIPGVPYEMKALMEQEILPRAKAHFSVNGLYYQTLMTQGIGESFLAEKIKNWEDRIYNDGLALAYLPSPGIVKLRLSSKKGTTDAQLINQYFDELKKQLPKYVYGTNDSSIFEVIGQLLKQKGLTLGTVESCTGGGIAHEIVQVSGSSAYFEGSLVTYSNRLKNKLALVQNKTLEKYGAVSEQVVREMAEGGRKVLGVDCIMAVSGVAGPDGGSPEKPVGTVWISIATPEITVAKKFLFGKDRGRNLTMTALSATNMLRQVILGVKRD